jgi:hypothetical protein
MKLSILMPVYNEEARVADAVKQALDVNYPTETELVIVDDGSRDRTAEILAGLDDQRIRVVLHPLGRHLMRDHHHGRVHRVATAPTVGEVEERSAADDHTEIRGPRPPVVRTGGREMEGQAGCRGRNLDVAGFVPVEK